MKSWKKTSPKTGPVMHKLFLGKKHVGSFYQPCRGGLFYVSCRLTGSKAGIVTEKEAKVWVEYCVTAWMADAGVVEKEETK